MNRALAGMAMLLTAAAAARVGPGKGTSVHTDRKQAQSDAATPRDAAITASQKGAYSIVNTIKIGGQALWQPVLLDPAGTLLYMPRGRKMVVIDATTGKDVGEIPTGPGADGIAIAPEAGRGFITSRSGTITVFDIKTYQVLGSITVGAGPGPIIYDPMSKRILVFCQGKLVPIVPTMDLATGKPEPGIDIVGKVSSMVADGHGMLYVGSVAQEQVSVVDTRVMKQVAVWPLHPIGRPIGMSMDRVHGRLFMACGDKMVVMSASDGHVIDSVGIGQRAMGTAFADGKVFVCGTEGIVAVLGQNAEGKFAVEQTILLGGSLHAPKVNPKTGEIYVPEMDLKDHRGVEGTFKLFVLGKKRLGEE